MQKELIDSLQKLGLAYDVTGDGLYAEIYYLNEKMLGLLVRRMAMINDYLMEQKTKQIKKMQQEIINSIY